MYYLSYTVTLKPGKRFDGLDHLKKLAKILKDKYDIESMVLLNTTGEVYRSHLVSSYERMAQIEEVGYKLFADDDFLAWFGESEDLIEWKNAFQHLYTVYE
jgi:DNA topoisomerase IB